MADFLYYFVAWLSFVLSALFGLGFVVILMLPMRLPIRIFYAFHHFRRWILWVALAGGVVAFIFAGLPTQGWILIGLQALFLLVYLGLDDARIFRAVMVSEFEEDSTRLMLDPEAPVIVLEVDGDVRAYPLSFVAHHHIVNDSISGKKVLVSFCPMCNSAMCYDATNTIKKRGFAVASVYHGNMVMTDLDTHTIWQQISGESLAGNLHPSKLPVLFYQMLPWKQAQSLFPAIKLAKTTAEDRLPFGKEMPFVWNRLQRSNYTPGLRRDKRLSARVRVLGIERIGGDLAYLKDDVTRRGWIRNDEVHLLIVMRGDCASGFLTEVEGFPRELVVQDGRIVDKKTGSVWNLRGQGLSGPSKEYSLMGWPVHDQFWFAWAEYHPLTQIIRVEPQIIAA